MQDRRSAVDVAALQCTGLAECRGRPAVQQAEPVQERERPMRKSGRDMAGRDPRAAQHGWASGRETSRQLGQKGACTLQPPNVLWQAGSRGTHSFVLMLERPRGRLSPVRRVLFLRCSGTCASLPPSAPQCESTAASLYWRAGHTIPTRLSRYLSNPLASQGTLRSTARAGQPMLVPACRLSPARPYGPAWGRCLLSPPHLSRRRGQSNLPALPRPLACLVFPSLSAFRGPASGHHNPLPARRPP